MPRGVTGNTTDSGSVIQGSNPCGAAQFEIFEKVVNNLERKLGRLPNDPTKPRLKLSRFLSATAPTYPENRDYLSKVSHFPMYLNDRIGDCTCATIGHIIQSVTTYGQGETKTITDSDVLQAYEAVSGYDPTTGANDNGAVVQEVLDYWRKNGVGGHKIAAFAEVDINNEDELRAAMNLFGTVYLGIAFPDTAFDQIDNGEPWDVVDGAKIEGGHAINAGYYDVSDNMWKIVTWGQVQPMTQAFWDEYVDEAWVVLTPEWFDANGRNPDGIDMKALGDQFTSLTGEANPFSDVVPTPSPDPAVDSVDQEFATAAKAWLVKHPYYYKPFQSALVTWLDEKGL